MSFEFFSPIWSHVNENEKKKMVKNPKFGILKTLVQTLQRSMRDFLGMNLLCTFRDVFEVFSPITPHNREKTKMQNNNETKKWSGEMVKRYLSTKFGIHLLDGF